MASSSERARKFEESARKFTADCATRWQEALQSQLRFQKSLAEQYGARLQELKKSAQQGSPNETARMMMSAYLSAVAFQREQMSILLDSQIGWNDLYSRFLDSLDDTAKPDSPKPQQ